MGRHPNQVRLDSSGNLYPAITTREHPQVYRLSIRLVTSIVPDLLKQAVKETLPAFPVFHVRMKRKRFWYYLEDTDEKPEVREWDGQEMQPFSEEGLQFRFLYKNSWIHLEAFHALTDETGALHFLHAVCYRYCQLVYGGLLPSAALKKRFGLEGAGNIQDAYQTVSKPNGNFWGLLKKRPAFQIDSERKTAGNREVSTANIPLEEVKIFSLAGIRGKGCGKREKNQDCNTCKSQTIF